MSSNTSQHVLLLGASGVTGLTFIKHHLSLPDSDDSKPFLTLYIRSSGRAKLESVLGSTATTDLVAHKIRVVEGSLTDANQVRAALSASGAFPTVTTVISLLGAYMSIYYFLTRAKPTPITDALKSTVIPAISSLGIKRILVLSTPSAFPVGAEARDMSWGWWFTSWIPKIVVPQGGAEMKGIAEAVLAQNDDILSSRPGLEATVFRVPFMGNAAGSANDEVRAFVLGGIGNTESQSLTRESMVVWLLNEMEERRWIGKAPVLANPK